MIPTLLATSASEFGLTPEQTAQILREGKLAPAKFQAAWVAQLQSWLRELDTKNPAPAKDSLNLIWQSWVNKATTSAIQHEIARSVENYHLSAQVVTVRCAITPDPILAEQIRNHFKNDLVIFEVDTTLIGGLQIYSNQKVFDYSWQGRLATLNSLL